MHVLLGTLQYWVLYSTTRYWYDAGTSTTDIPVLVVRWDDGEPSGCAGGTGQVSQASSLGAVAIVENDCLAMSSVVDQ